MKHPQKTMDLFQQAIACLKIHAPTDAGAKQILQEYNMRNLNYPIPDPAWDYATVYDRLYQSKFDIEQLISQTSQIEDATGETDAAAIAKLEHVITQLQETRRLLRRS